VSARTSDILVLTSCTATKAPVAARRGAPAEELYAGQQHVRLMRGVNAYRGAGEPSGALDLRIVSAGHGVVPARRPLLPYDETFSELPRGEVRRRGEALGIPAAVASALAQPRALNVVLLGDLYLHASALPDDLVLGAPTLALTSPNSGRRLPDLPGLVVVGLHNREARRFSCGLAALKGELARRLLVRLADGTPAADVPATAEGFLTWLEDQACAVPDQLPLMAA
jgi:hypothetical protein